MDEEIFDISDEDEHSSADPDPREDEMSSDDEDRSQLCSRRKRRRNTSEIYPGERRQKTAREQQMLLLKQKRSRISERKKIDSENKQKEYSDETSDEGVMVTPRKKKKTRVINVSDDSEQEYSDHSQPAKRIEPKDDEIYCYKSTRQGCQRVFIISDNEEMPGEEKEEARLNQSGEKQASFDSIELQDASDSTEKLILDYVAETNEALVTVHPRLSEKLKPHQVEGVTFMWEKCFESVEKLQKGPGGGCILAHCMGLGKTLQVITLVHTLLTHECTKMKSVLVLCPAGTILNWASEFEQWLSGLDDEKIKIYNLTKLRKIDQRLDALETWTGNGGVMIIGYEMFRSLLNNKKTKKNDRKRMLRALLHPDLVVCDEAHVLKNDRTALTRTVMKIQTSRRILLTGTPLQNNLMEFYCMLRFAKLGLLGSKKNFQNRFGHTITQGQFLNSDPEDVSSMKQCAYVLNRLSSSITQRRDHDVLKQYLPPKREFVVIVNLSDVQAKLYKRYLETQSMIASSYKRKDMKLLADYQKMRLIWTHPLAIKYVPQQQRKKTSHRSSTSDEEQSDTSGTYSSESSDESSVLTSSTSDEEQSDTSGTSSCSEDNGRKMRIKERKKRRSRKKTPETNSKVRRGMRIVSSDDDDEPEKPKKYRRILPISSDDEMNEMESAGYQRLGVEGDNANDVCPPNDDEKSTYDNDEVNSEEDDEPWWRDCLSDEDFENLDNGPKMPLLFSLLNECEKIGDKVLVFSQSLASLGSIEHFLKKYAEFAESLSQNSCSTESNDFVGEWVEGIDYFRLDGSTTKEKRAEYCKVFNDQENKRARLFLISTKAGGLGINLTAANRVVIFDASWNPSNDIQSIYRIYRFGQTKPCYVYRFISQATMEEKIYERQVTKLSIARRVIDEDQIDRHFTREEVGDLYAFNRVKPMADDLANNPVADNLLARLLERFPEFIINVHEHDSFLMNNEEEELTEEERRMADKELGRSRSERADHGATPVDLTEKIRSVLSQIRVSTNGNSSNGDFSFSESDVKLLQQKLVQLYEKEKKQRLLECHAGVGSQNSFNKSIPTDEKAKRNGPGVSYEDRRRPIFGMSINKVPEKFRDPERLEIEQRALLHILRADANQTSSSTGPPKIPKTWVLTCPEKDAAELEEIFKSEYAHWWRLPDFSSVGAHLLLHFEICVRRDTLEEKLRKYGIRMEVVNPDFETMQSLIESSHSGPARKKDILSDGGDNDDDDDDDDAYATELDDEYYEDFDSDSEEDRLRYEDQYNVYYDEDRMRKMTKSFIS